MDSPTSLDPRIEEILDFFDDIVTWGWRPHLRKMLGEQVDLLRTILAEDGRFTPPAPSPGPYEYLQPCEDVARAARHDLRAATDKITELINLLNRKANP